MATPATVEKPEIQLPDSAAACADLLYKTREKRLKVQKEVDKLEALEKALKEYFINNLPKDQTGVIGKVACVRTENKVIPQVNDWDALYAYIKKKGAFYLLQRRLTESAVNDMWAQNKQIPGVGTFTTVKVSCTKR